MHIVYKQYNNLLHFYEEKIHYLALNSYHYILFLILDIQHSLKQQLLSDVDGFLIFSSDIPLDAYE